MTRVKIKQNPTPWLIVCLLALLLVASAALVGSRMVRVEDDTPRTVIPLAPAPETGLTAALPTAGQAQKTAYPVATATTMAWTTTTVQPMTTTAQRPEFAPAGPELARLADNVTQDTGFQVIDGKQTWYTTSDAQVDIFRSAYEDADGNIVVSSADGQTNVLAPGTDNTYEFRVSNTGSVPLEFDLTAEAWFGTKDGSADYVIPVEVTFRNDYYHDYLLGGEGDYADVLELNNVSDHRALSGNSYMDYVLDWQWLFDQGRDEADTALGVRAGGEDLTLTVALHVTATVYDDDDDGDDTPATPQDDTPSGELNGNAGDNIGGDTPSDTLNGNAGDTPSDTLSGNAGDGPVGELSGNAGDNIGGDPIGDTIDGNAGGDTIDGDPGGDQDPAHKLPGGVPQTGDDSQPLLWALMAVGSLAAILLLLLVWRRKEGEDDRN
jgi:LPXTG-motif cell wall-anchored protein